MVQGQTARVLVVEHDEKIIRFVADAVVSAGYAVSVARTRPDAWRLISKGLCRPSLVVLDIGRPRRAGLTLLHRFRERPASKHTPILVISRCNELAHKLQCFDQGASDVLPKSIAKSELIARINVHMAVARYADQWRRESAIDSLTELLNRRGMQAHLEMELSYAVKHRTNLAVIFFDLNNFKRLNDRLGHAHGDQVLRDIAAIMTEAVRNTDLTGRWGGDEFVIACPGLDRPGAQRIVREIAWQAKRKVRSPQFGIAAGISCLGEMAASTASAKDLVNRADQEMYRHKAAGTSGGGGFSLARGTGGWEWDNEKRTNV